MRCLLRAVRFLASSALPPHPSQTSTWRRSCSPARARTTTTGALGELDSCHTCTLRSSCSSCCPGHQTAEQCSTDTCYPSPAPMCHVQGQHRTGGLGGRGRIRRRSRVLRVGLASSSSNRQHEPQHACAASLSEWRRQVQRSGRDPWQLAEAGSKRQPQPEAALQGDVFVHPF